MEQKVRAMPHPVSVSDNSDRSKGSSVLTKILAISLFVWLYFGYNSYHFLCRAPTTKSEDAKELLHSGRPLPPIWTPCFDSPRHEANLLCSMIPVPLNHFDLTDERSYQIAVSMIPAKTGERKGALFLNPGGPGGSGTAQVQGVRGPAIWRVLKGQYDIVGFDPRGINLTKPAISCFDTLAEQYLYNIAVPSSLDIPSNLSLLRPHDLDSQLGIYRASLIGVANKCIEKHGDYLKYVSTADVVRDIDWMARAIGGQDAKVNFWGFSYGTIIGQYLVQLLEPSRIGHVVIDGVVDPNLWVDYGIEEMADGLDDIDNVLYSFAESCLSNGPSLCPLAAHFSKASDLLEAMDALIDSLYLSPQPSSSKNIPSLIYRAGHIRQAYFQITYRTSQWKSFSEALEKALFPKEKEEPLKELVDMFHSGLPANVTLANATTMPGRSVFAGNCVVCADSRPYDEERPPPTTEEFADYLLKTLEKYSSRMGDGFQTTAHCDLWKIDWQNRYPGPFGLPNNTLELPMLITSQHFDPVTPLLHAKRAWNRLGSNARLLEQVDGWGHCAIGQTSYCTAKVLQNYFTEDIVPEPYTTCKVDQVPFQPWNDTQVAESLREVTFVTGGEEDDMVQLLRDWSLIGEGIGLPWNI
ncbi:hypothetical protein BT69DRAFT_1240921 [Atractiella rhizophila]|nr:hypothetical protein BT69DRAFT_1240921 [Atractiella rhizophila]